MPVTAGYRMGASGYYYRLSDQTGPYVYDGTNMRLAPAATANPPDLPVVGTATSDFASIYVPYVAPADTGGAAITSYDAKIMDAYGNTVAIVTGVANPAVFGSGQGIVPGGQYRIAVRGVNSAGPGSFSQPSNLISLVPSPLYTIATYQMGAGTTGTTGFMSLMTFKDTNRLETIIKNQTPWTLITAEDTANNLTTNQPDPSAYVNLPPNSENFIAGNASKLFLGSAALATSSVTSSGTTCTIVFPSPHGFTSGDFATTLDFVPSGYNVSPAAVTVVDANTITIQLASSQSAVTTTGKVFPRPIKGITIETKTTL